VALASPRRASPGASQAPELRSGARGRASPGEALLGDASATYCYYFYYYY